MNQKDREFVDRVKSFELQWEIITAKSVRKLIEILEREIEETKKKAARDSL